jgi:hypothetical protein
MNKLSVALSLMLGFMPALCGSRKLYQVTRDTYSNGIEKVLCSQDAPHFLCNVSIVPVQLLTVMIFDQNIMRNKQYSDQAF